jgi:AsmA family protein
MPPANQTVWSRIPLWVRWVAGSVLVLVLGLVLLFTAFDWNWARGPLGRYLSARTGRVVHIDGPLAVRLKGGMITVQIEQLGVDNAPWAGTEPLFKADRIATGIELGKLFTGHLVLPYLELDNAAMSLTRDAQGRANWGAAARGSSGVGPRLPLIRHVAVKDAAFELSDAIRHMHLKATLNATEGDPGSGVEPFALRGEGTLNRESFHMKFAGGALVELRTDRPYEFDLDVEAVGSHLLAHGQLARPFDFSQLDAELQINGRNMGNLYYLIGLALPYTPPYHVKGHLHAAGPTVTFTEAVAKVGSSDLHGQLTVTLDRDRPRIKADLISKSLNLDDLTPAFGKGIPEPSHSGSEPPPPPPAPTGSGDTLLPTYTFEFERLKTTDAEVHLHADSLQTAKIPAQNADINVDIDDGVLNIDPFVVRLPEGAFKGSLHTDTRKPVAVSQLELTVSDIKLDQLKGKGDAPAPLAGTLQARMHLEGEGNSVHDFAANAKGKIVAVLPHGEIRQAFAELTGINVAKGLGLLLSGNQQRTEIRCGLADFSVEQGDARLTQAKVDTDVVLMTGSGDVNFASEALNIDINGQPKHLHFVRLRTPITVRGTFKHPSIGISATKAIGQGGIAAALAALTPVAALLAFVDPGLAKNENCLALMQSANEQGLATKTAQP